METTKQKREETLKKEAKKKRIKISGVKRIKEMVNYEKLLESKFPDPFGDTPISDYVQELKKLKNIDETTFINIVQNPQNFSKNIKLVAIYLKCLNYYSKLEFGFHGREERRLANIGFKFRKGDLKNMMKLLKKKKNGEIEKLLVLDFLTNLEFEFSSNFDLLEKIIECFKNIVKSTCSYKIFLLTLNFGLKIEKFYSQYFPRLAKLQNKCKEIIFGNFKKIKNFENFKIDKETKKLAVRYNSHL